VKRFTTAPLGPKAAASILSIGLHTALASALVLASGSSDSDHPAPGQPLSDGHLIWVTVAAPTDPIGTTARPAPAASRRAAPNRNVAPSPARPIRTAAHVTPSPARRRVEASAIRTEPSPRPSPRHAPRPVSADPAISEPPDVADAESSAVETAGSSGERTATELATAAGAAASGLLPTGTHAATAPTDAAPVGTPARPRRLIQPEYPRSARQQGDESLVVVEAWIDDSGDVTSSSVLESGGADFDASALRAVERSSFEPARLGGRAVSSRVALRIHFSMRN